MGCCVSTPRTQKHHAFESKSPPPSVLEDEETIVKEVLSVSETPQLPQQHQQYQQQQKPRQPLVGEIKNVRDNQIEKTENGFQEKPEQEETETTLSEQEVSEAFSDTLSTTTNTTTTNTTTLINNSNKGVNGNTNSDNEEYSYGASYHQEVKQRVNRSQSPAPRTGARNRVMGKSPTRRTDQSPIRRGGGCGGGGGGGGGGGSVRLVQNSRDDQLELGNAGQLGRAVIRRSGFRSDQNRRDPGEDSVRTSKSPATNRSVMGRSPSAQRTNRSPGRIRLGPNENVSSDNTNDTMWENSNTTDESLENPLVSLECFIFL